MPRKKKDESAETSVETTEVAGEETLVAGDTAEISAADAGIDSDANAATSDSDAGEATDEPSIVESVVGAAASAIGSVASAVGKGATGLVSALTGTGDVEPEKKISKRAEKIGVVASDKMMKTVTVRVDRLVKHPVYRKYIKKRKKFMAHDDLGAKIGDKVKIVETRPMSARKRWRVVEIIQKAEL